MKVLSDFTDHLVIVLILLLGWVDKVMGVILSLSKDKNVIQLTS